jgi:hypothetical protein
VSASRAATLIVAGLTCLAAPAEAAASEPTPDEAGERPSRAPAILTGSVALAGLGVGVAYTVDSARLAASLERDLADDVQFDAEDPRIARGKREAVLAGVMFAATGVLASLTIYYLVRKAKAKRSAAARPAVRMSWGGVAF